MGRNGYLGTSDQIPGPPFTPAKSISYKTGIFPLSDDLFGIYLMFCAQFSFDLVTVACDLLTLTSLIRQTYLLILSFLRLFVPELCVTQSDHITVTWNGPAHAPCHNTYHRGQKWSTFLKSLNPICHYVTFRKLRRRLSHIIGEK